MGITWILEGLEVTMMDYIAAVLKDPESGMGLGSDEVGYDGALYIACACTGGAVLLLPLSERFELPTLIRRQASPLRVLD